MIIETSSKCNLKCPMCPQSLDSEGEVRRNNFDEKFTKELVKYFPSLTALQLHGIGEPLLSNIFWELIEYIDEKTWASVNTNLTILDDEKISKLVFSELKCINISIDAANENTYKNIRGWDWQKLLSNIRKLVDFRNENSWLKFPRESLSIRTNMTLMKENIDQIIDFMDLMIGDIGCDGVEVWPMNDYGKVVNGNYKQITELGWDFDYNYQGLWDDVSLLEDKINEAQLYAEEKGWELYARA